MLEAFMDLMRRGGPVMWPLLALSLLAVTLAFERAWFFVRLNHAAKLAAVAKLGSLLRQGERQRALDQAESDSGVYGSMLRQLLAEPVRNEAAAVAAIDSQRGRLERFLPLLSTIITAAPMLGILGTVLGIIASFEVLSAQAASTDPRSVSQGIAEALITTAAGLVVSLITLFPYNLFRAQVDRTLTRLEALAAAAMRNGNPQPKPDTVAKS